MIRVRQFAHHEQLSYLLLDPISRRSALIDPSPDLEEQYRQQLQHLGLKNFYLLFTGIRPTGVRPSGIRPSGGRPSGVGPIGIREQLDLPGLRLDPAEQSQLPATLPLGESVIRCLLSDNQFCAYRCEGFLFTGDRYLPGDLTVTAGKPQFSTLLSLDDDMVIYPGHSVHGVRISCLGQEKALAAAGAARPDHSMGDYHA